MGDRKSAYLGVKLTTAQQAKLNAASQATGLRQSTVVRGLIDQFILIQPSNSQQQHGVSTASAPSGKK